MTANINTYNDFQGLSQLKSDASARSPDATREAARQFEALFVQMMLKSMRDANAVLGEERDTTYDEMFDKQISLDMTRGKGLGMGDMLVRQLGGTEAPEAAPAGSVGQSPLALLLQRVPAALRATVPELPGIIAPRLSIPDPTELRANLNLQLPALPDLDSSLPAGTSRGDFRPETRADFVREVWPLAVRAGKQLGVDPRAIVAQAALETGWGRRLIRDDAGVSGNNLFGIKADRAWSGERVTVTTLEYEGGLPKPQRAQFRAYPDLATGFQDYVDFMRGNPRYSEALRTGGSAHEYAARLQSAGYATDPRYAEKIRSIIAGPTLSTVLPTLKDVTDVPTYL